MAETPEVSNMEVVNAGMNAYALRQSNWIDARVLGIATVETFQAPAGARYALFSSTGDFYCKTATASTAAAIPSGDVTDGTAPELNPAMRYIGELEFISLISPAACVVTIQYFR